MAREERDQQGRAWRAEPASDLPEALAPPLPDGAHRRLSPGQAIVLILLAATVLILAATYPAQLTDVFRGLFMTGFTLSALVKLSAACTPRATAAPAPSDEAALPVYTVICPLFREAAVAAELVENLSRLDYPRDRLQVLIALEAKDHETQAAFQALPLPTFIQVLIVPPGSPQTKPRACNHALERARGQLVVIYDAEDAPHPGQLREAATRFAAEGPGLACLQAPLRIEPDRRFIGEQFALEYAVQFEVLQPALARWGLPFPLGGTSNHFRGEALRAIGGWDPYNVTEDADIGFRLAARGYRLGVIASPTLETAPALRPWFPQRARWVKGHIQTLAVHLRGPAARSPRGLASLVLTLALSVASSHLHGPLFFWLLAKMVGALLGFNGLIAGEDIVVLVFGWACASIAGVRGLERAGVKPRFLPLFGAVLYWPLQSLAAVRAAVQFVVAPFHWDKTPHQPRAAPETARPISPPISPQTGRALP
jgi:cellulose synthase/poly-beta-1,6-N-acetylglucosamine synthase-like glycosyltransferase